MNLEENEQKEKKSVRRLIFFIAGIVLIIVAAAVIGFLATRTAVTAAQDQAVKDEIITQNSRLRQSAADGVLSSDMITRTKSTDTVAVDLKVASDGKRYCIEAALRHDAKLSRYHMNQGTPELEPQRGLCGEGASERPAAPPEFSLAASGPGSLSFTWGVVPDARSYEVRCSASTQEALTKSTRMAALTLENVKAGVVYTCRVTAENTAGKSGDSMSVGATAKLPLAVPEGVKLTGRTSSSLSYSWTSVPETKYYVFEYAQDESFTKNVKKETTTSPQIMLKGLSTDTAYYVHVKAVTKTNTEQQAPYSMVVQGRTEK